MRNGELSAVCQLVRLAQEARRLVEKSGLERPIISPGSGSIQYSVSHHKIASDSASSIDGRWARSFESTPAGAPSAPS